MFSAFTCFYPDSRPTCERQNRRGERVDDQLSDGSRAPYNYTVPTHVMLSLSAL